MIPQVDAPAEHGTAFSRLAIWIGAQLGKPHIFAIAVLMVFLLQHTQNRDTKVIQLELNELISANENARNALLGLKDLSDENMRCLQARSSSLAKLGTVPEELHEAQVELENARKDMNYAEDHIERAVEKVCG